MNFTAEYTFFDGDGGKMESGHGKVALDKENLRFLPELGAPLLLSWRDILELKPSDYEISILILSGDKIELSSLGYKFEDFIKIASHFRNEMLIKDSLLNEPLKKSQIEAEYSFFDIGDKVLSKGVCELRIYETAALIIPEKNEIKKIPFRDIKSVAEGDLFVTINLDSGEKLRFSKLGNKFDYFKTHLSKQMNQILLEGQELIKSVSPEISGLILRKASLILKEGKIIPLKKMDEIYPEFSKNLGKAVCSDPENKKEYEFLKSLSMTDKIYFGFKKGLTGSLSGDYMLFLFPIYSADIEKPGNAVAMEAFKLETICGKSVARGNTNDSKTSNADVIGKKIVSMLSKAINVDGKLDAGCRDKNTENKATYFFKLASRKNYSLAKNISELDEKMNVFGQFFNRAMSAINFRRAPLFLSDEKLEDAKYAKYRSAIAKVKELRILRDSYIGRIIHSSYESWSEDIKKLLAFNVTSLDDSVKFKGMVLSAEEEKIDDEETIGRFDEHSS
ncbi:MAG: hypothetical protein L6420_05075 [Elusimicrobia bacterium]|nr:hypothetical protein [Elusimicrobiota bacterium]